MRQEWHLPSFDQCLKRHARYDATGLAAIGPESSLVEAIGPAGRRDVCALRAAGIKACWWCACLHSSEE